MATDYRLDMTAHLDTSQVDQKLHQLSKTGQHATDNLETAVKKLDNAVQDLTRSWEKQAQAAQRAASAAESAAHSSSAGSAGGEGGIVTQAAQMAIGQMGARQIRSIAKLIKNAGYGDSALGQMATGGLSWGATAMVATKGNPIAAAGGVIIGIVDSAMKRLVESAEKAGEAIRSAALEQSKLFKSFHDREKDTALKKTLEGMEDESDIMLNYRVQKAQRSRQAYEEFTTKGSAAQKQFIEDYTGSGGEDLAQQLERVASGLKKQMEDDERLATAAQKVIDYRTKLADIELVQAQKEEVAAIKRRIAQEKEVALEMEESRKEYDKNYKEGAALLGDIARERDDRSFREQLQNMKTPELVRLSDKLRKERDKLESDSMSLAAEAMNENDPEKMREAKNMRAASKQKGSRLAEVEGVLGQIAVNNAPYLSQLLSDSMSSEAKKGYDVGGYSTIEDAVWKQQLEQQEKIQVNTSKTADDMNTVKQAITQIKNVVENNGVGGTWGK